METINSDIYTFNPNFSVYAKIPGVYSIQDLEKEQGVYSATPDFVNKRCGDIAKNILKSVPEDYFKLADELKLWLILTLESIGYIRGITQLIRVGTVTESLERLILANLI